MADAGIEIGFSVSGADEVTAAIEKTAKSLKRLSGNGGVVVDFVKLRRETESASVAESKLAASAERARGATASKASSAEKSAKSAEREAAANARSAQSSERAARASASASRVSGPVYGGGSIAIAGSDELKASAAVISASIRGAGMALSAASVALTNSSNALLKATGNIASLAGVGGAVGSAFGMRGSIAGSVFGASWGVGSMIFDKWIVGMLDETKTEKWQAKQEKLREKRKTEREGRYEELVFGKQLAGLETADDAAQALKSLNEQLDELRLKRLAGTLEGRPEEWDARAKTLEARIAQVGGLKDRLGAEEAAAKAESRKSAVAEIAGTALSRREAKEFEKSYSAASGAARISMLEKALEESATKIMNLRAKLGSEGLSDSDFSATASKFAAALDAETDLRMRLQDERAALAEAGGDASAIGSGGNGLASASRQVDSLSRIGGTIGGSSSALAASSQRTARNTERMAASLDAISRKISSSPGGNAVAVYAA